jgi:hypothetical protein
MYRESARTIKKPAKSDVKSTKKRMYPIRHDWPMAGIPAGNHECRTLLQIIKDQLPFNFRFQKAGKNKGRAGTHPDYADVEVGVPRTGMPADELLILPSLSS